MRDAIEEFRAAIRDAGLHPPDVVVPDGKVRRFASHGKHGDDAGWYVFHDDNIPAGKFGDWRTGHSGTWRADIGRKPSPHEEAAYRARVDAMQREREAEDATRKTEAREKSVGIWQAAEPAQDDHPYLVKKSIRAHALRVHEGALVIPVRDGAELHSLQFIGAEGDKRFLTGGRVSGCYFPIGEPNGVLCIAEGFATGASIHEATGSAVAVAFTAGNLLPVARALRTKFPQLRLTVCADDDASSPGNPGLTKAREAAQAVGALLAVPDFGADRPEGATDFNDLYRHAGREAVRASIERARPAESGGDGDRDAWPKPKPIIAELMPVPAFDADTLLPEALRAWIMDEAERMPCPPDFVAAAALVALGSIIGARCAIKPKARDSWLIVPNLWGGIVGDPSAKKSPAWGAALKPLDRLIAKALEAYTAALAVPVVDERDVPVAADDDVVEHPDAEEVGGFPEATGDLDVLLRWRRVAGRVVVGHGERGGVGEEQCLEHLARVDECACERADADLLDADEAVLGVQDKRDEPFAVPHCGLLAQQSVDVCCAAEGDRLHRWRLTDELDADARRREAGSPMGHGASEG